MSIYISAWFLTTLMQYRITSDATQPPPLPLEMLEDIAHDFCTRTFVVETPCCVCKKILTGYCNQVRTLFICHSPLVI